MFLRMQVAGMLWLIESSFRPPIVMTSPLKESPMRQITSMKKKAFEGMLGTRKFMKRRGLSLAAVVLMAAPLIGATTTPVSPSLMRCVEPKGESVSGALDGNFKIHCGSSGGGGPSDCLPIMRPSQGCK